MGLVYSMLFAELSDVRLMGRIKSEQSLRLCEVADEDNAVAWRFAVTTRGTSSAIEGRGERRMNDVAKELGRKAAMLERQLDRETRLFNGMVEGEGGTEWRAPLSPNQEDYKDVHIRARDRKRMMMSELSD